MSTKHKPIILPHQGRYIAGYMYNNGCRDVFLYISKIYRGQYAYTFDYTYAKTFSRETAEKHAGIIADLINNTGGALC